MPVKNSHTVTKSYLKGFTVKRKNTDKLIWVYDKSTGNKPELKSIKKYPTEKFYYTQEDEKGKLENDSMEIGLGKIESLVIPIIRKIRGKSGQKVNISKDEYASLAFHIGISMTRVQSVREPLKCIRKKIATKIFEQLKDSGELPPPPDELKNHLDNISIDVKNWVTLEPMIKMGSQICKSLLKKYWEFFLPAPNMSFVTSDNPVIFIADKKYGNALIGPAHPLSEIGIPLRRDLALVCSPLENVPEGDRDKGHGMIFQFNEKDTNRFNLDIARAARKYVFADHRSDELAKLVFELKGTEQTILL